MKTALFSLSVFLLAFMLFVSVPVVAAQEASPSPSPASSPTPSPNQNEAIDRLKQVIDELQSKLSGVQKERQSLASTVKFLDSKIQLNEKEIEKTQAEIRLLEAQINDLGERIEGLEVSLHELSATLVERIQSSYKRGSTDAVSRVFATTGLSSFFQEAKYLSQVRAHTQELLLNTERKRQAYDEEKTTKEEKQEEILALQAKLQIQQRDLQQQKQDKNRLLELTKNDEKTYQDQLSKTLAEYNAIQAIVSGGGNETEIRGVKSGEQIATIISGASVCSTGTHLHLEVRQDGGLKNPASYLKSESVQWRDSAFDLTGNWEWPVNDPAIITQGYGFTSWSRTGFYGGQPHTGIDMVSKSANLAVKAVKDGTLYRGSVRCGKGNLRYVRVKHDGGVSTYYLHVNY